MTPIEEAQKIFDKFKQVNTQNGYANTISVFATLSCAKIAVRMEIEILSRNSGYTQCLIDLKHYEQVLEALNKM